VADRQTMQTITIAGPHIVANQLISITFSVKASWARLSCNTFLEYRPLLYLPQGGGPQPCFILNSARVVAASSDFGMHFR